MSMETVRISIIPYLNTLPFRYGLQARPPGSPIRVSYESPAGCALQLKKKMSDIGLVPVAAIPEIAGLNIIPGFCIASPAAAETVCIFSQQPIESSRRILLDHNSRTSAELARLLCREHWKTEPIFEDGQAGYEDQIGGGTAGLIIGNRAIQHRHRFAYCYDLGEAWFRMTGLPFVFAVWASSRPIPEPFIREFVRSLEYGVSHTREALQYGREETESLHDFDPQRYLTQSMDFRLDQEKLTGLRRFFAYLPNAQKETESAIASLL